MTRKASGPFEVAMQPQPDTFPERRLLSKRYHGALEATAEGQMLSALGGRPGSAGYVALERVTGTLEGRQGSFMLQHSGTMNRGEPSLVITVVPDSGTGQLAGLAGRMGIRIEAGGKHFYDLDYTLEP